MCRNYDQASRAKTLWRDVLRREIIAGNLFTPRHRRPFEELSNVECEALVLHALKLRLSLAKSKSKPAIVPFHQQRSVTWVKIVKSHWLLVASSDGSSSALGIWKLASLKANVATSLLPLGEIYLDGPVVNGLVDVRKEEVIIALEMSTKRFVS